MALGECFPAVDDGGSGEVGMSETERRLYFGLCFGEVMSRIRWIREVNNAYLVDTWSVLNRC